MVLDKLNNYWTYIPFKDSNDNDVVLGFFNIPNYENKAFLYTNKNIKYYNIPFEMNNIQEISSYVEIDELLNKFTQEEKDLYYTILTENKVSIYYLYMFDCNKENIDNLINIINNKSSSSTKHDKKDSKMQKFEDFDNSDQLTFYIIVRNDLDSDIGLQMTYISDMTKTIQEDLRIKSFSSDIFKEWYYNFVDLTTNTVILQASGKDLFEDNYIPSEYKDKRFLFNYIWDDEERVAHNNFRLKEGNITCLGYFGKKKDLPKFIRKLKLYGGK